MGTGTGEAERVAGPPLRAAGQGWARAWKEAPAPGSERWAAAARHTQEEARSDTYTFLTSHF